MPVTGKARAVRAFLLATLGVGLLPVHARAQHQPAASLQLPIVSSSIKPVQFTQSTELPMPASAVPSIEVKPPPLDTGLRPLPITLPAALKLVNVRSLDIVAAQERLQVAAAQLKQAKVLWLPTVTLGTDYFRHEGPYQDVNGRLVDSSYSALMTGLGSGIGNAGIIPVNDAIFAPLSARQIVQAREADVQATTNDVFVSATDAYFTVQQARGELAGAIETAQRTQELSNRIEKLAAGLVSPVEVVRAQTELMRRRQAEVSARERWRVVGAELVRVLHLEQGVQVEPLEPPTLSVGLIDANAPIDELLFTGLKNRPELASMQQQVDSALTQLRQEKWRPFVPSLLLRGGSTTPAGTLGYGVFGGGPDSSMSNFNNRLDADVQLLWQFENLGFGNKSKIDQRAAESRLSQVEFLRLKDRVAAEIAQAHTQAQLAAERRGLAEQGLRLAVESADKNLQGLAQTRVNAGGLVILVIRPQEAVASVQALSQAYIDYFSAVADANRAQFRLYRALGRPAQLLVDGAP